MTDLNSRKLMIKKVVQNDLFPHSHTKSNYFENLKKMSESQKKTFSPRNATCHFLRELRPGRHYFNRTWLLPYSLYRACAESFCIIRRTQPSWIIHNFSATNRIDLSKLVCWTSIWLCFHMSLCSTDLWIHACDIE